MVSVFAKLKVIIVFADMAVEVLIAIEVIVAMSMDIVLLAIFVVDRNTNLSR